MSENLPATTQPSALITVIERIVRDPSIDIARLEQMFALQERIEAREAKRQYAEAMNRFQREMPQVTRDAVNKFARNRYVTYEAIDRVIRPEYVRQGFSVSFRTKVVDRRMRVTCVVLHISGHEEAEYDFESGPDTAGARGEHNKTEAQGFGSVITYGKKYTLCAAFAIALSDDETDTDGWHPQRGNMPPPRQQHRPQPPQSPDFTPPPRPNGGGNDDVWMRDTKRMIDEQQEPSAKILTLTKRLEPWWDDLDRLEAFAGNPAWLAYEPDFPTDKDMLADVVDKRLNELREAKAQ